MHECFVWLPAVRGLVVTSPSDQELHGRSALVIEENEDDEVGLFALSSLLSPRSLDRLGLNDQWDVSSSKSFESRARLDPDER